MFAFLQSGRFYYGEIQIFRVRFRPEADVAPKRNCPGPIAVSPSRLYSGSVTLNSIAANCSGDLPMLSRNGSQRGSN